MLLQLRCDLIIGFINSINEELGVPYTHRNFQRGGKCIVEGGIITGIGRCCAAPAAGNFPDDGLCCCMTAEFLEPHRFCISTAGDFPLTVHQNHTHGFYLFSGKPFQGTGAIGHAADGGGRTAVSTGFTQYNTGFNTVGHIVVIFITGLILQIDRVKG